MVVKPVLALLPCIGLLGAAALAQPPFERGRVPPGHMPPPGECRVWQDGVPPGQQQPPTSCRQARIDAARNGGFVVYGDERRGKKRDRDYDRDRDWERDRDGRRPRTAEEAVIDIILGDLVLRDWAMTSYDTDGNGRLDAREARRAEEAYLSDEEARGKPGEARGRRDKAREKKDER